MVLATINISKETNQILNLVKVKYNLKNLSEAIDWITMEYGQALLDLELRPEFIEKMKKRQREPAIEVEFKNFDKHFGLE